MTQAETVQHDKPSQPKRRWFQFGLRTLVILTTICAMVFGALARWSQKACRQREAVAAIQWGAEVYYDFQTLHPGAQPDDYYFHEGVVKGSPAYWPKWLVDALGVNYFANVESVWITNQSWDPDDFEFVKHFPELKRLGLHGTWASDVGLELVTEAKSLQWLDLESTTVTDAGLEHVKRLTNLQSLSLRNLKVTDAGLEHLHRLTALETLNLEKTKVTDAGVQRLQKALPNCKIDR